MVDPKRHTENRGWVESILHHIPGFQGYLDAEYRRDSDRLARQHLFDCLGVCKRNIDEFQHQLVNNGSLDDLTQCERVVSALITLGNRIQGDVEGYSGFFDFVKIGPEQLDQVYEHDMALVDDVEILTNLSKQLTTSSDSPRSLAAKLKEQVDLIANKFGERTKILQGLTE